MTSNQRAVVNNMKNQAGWIDTVTPPPGHVLNAQGYAVASTTLAPAQFIPLPPPPPPPPAPQAPAIPGHISVVTGSAGSAFGARGGVRRIGETDSTTGTIGSVMINGQQTNQAVYDRHGTRLA